MNSLVDVFALILLGAVFWALGVCAVLASGLILHAMFFDHPEGFLIWVIVIWTLVCIAGALRYGSRILIRRF